MPSRPAVRQLDGPISFGLHNTDRIKTRVEYHTEFVTVTRVTMLAEEANQWPVPTFAVCDIIEMLGLSSASIICQVSILVMGPAPDDLGSTCQSSDLPTPLRHRSGQGPAKFALISRFVQTGGATLCYSTKI